MWWWGTDLLGTLHLPRQTEQQLVGNGVHQVQEGCVLVEDVVERRPLQAQVLEEEVEQTGDPGRSDRGEQPEEIKGLTYSSKRSSAFICCHGGGGCVHTVSLLSGLTGSSAAIFFFFRSKSFVKHMSP